ncbi:MAG: response regulator transcription factor [Gammaproteobacteria bacterium]|nr:response regulator transcription factor [Gammaproteobacteria bacterium]
MNTGVVNKELLLVDDDLAFCEVLSRALQRHGYNVCAVQSVAEGRKVAEQQAFGCAVVDLRIGQDSGLSMVEILVTLQPDISIVVLTGYASIATAVEAIKLGASQYLTKPAEVEDIIDAFDKIPGDVNVEAAANPMSIKRLEWEHLQKVLHEHDGNISAAARAMNMHRRTLQRKLQKKPVKH